MKKIVFSLAFMLMTSFAFANNVESDKYALAPSLDKIKFTLNLGKLNNLSDENIKTSINEFLVKNLSNVSKELECTVDITATLDIGAIKGEVKISITGPCVEVLNQAPILAEQIIERIKRRLLKKG